MDPQLIKSLIDALASSSLSALSYSQDGHTLRLAQRGAPLSEVAGDVAPAAMSLHPLAAAPTAASSVTAVVASHLVAPSQAPAPSVCASPLYGVVHLQATPGEPPFVAVGDAVRAGQTLCVVEAMKVFNEVQAERTGVVQAVLVQTGDEVEAGQALFQLA